MKAKVTAKHGNSLSHALYSGQWSVPQRVYSRPPRKCCAFLLFIASRCIPDQNTVMPGRLAGRKRLSTTFDSDDDNESPDTSPYAGQQSSAKRARLNGSGLDVGLWSAASCISTLTMIQNGKGDLLPSSYRSDVQGAGSPDGLHGLRSSPQKHHSGSIVRVTLKNFVTYTNAEFFPGPSLNMVIGPNGTGKSTLVCAICLGLGWKTEHLGRAKDIGDFVKHGAKQAEIEIELAGDPERHDTNPVIKHQIKKDEKKHGVFYLNNRQVPRKTVTELCKSFYIQVDNLCQFLPQDRVVEFAALNPVDLLTQTQRAAAPEHMVQWHEELKKMRVDQRARQNDQTTLSDSLKNLEGRQNGQRADVERLQERQDIQERIDALEVYRPVVAYRRAKKDFEGLQARKREADHALEQLQEEVAPALQDVKEKVKYVEALQVVVKRREQMVSRSQQEADKVAKKQKDLADAIKDCENEMNAEKNATKKQRQDRARLDNDVRNIQRQQEQAPPEFNAAEYNERLRELKRREGEVRDKRDEENTKERECANQINRREGSIQNTINEGKNLRSQAGQQMSKLRLRSEDTFKAWEWIQKNQNVFTSRVFGPAIVSCSVKEARHAGMVESMLSNAEMLAFTVTNQADFRLLQDKLFDTLRLSDINIRNTTMALEQYRAPSSQEELRQLGLDTYLLDLLEGPSEVLAMLCDNRNIHQTGVAFRELSTNQYNAITRSPISSFVTPQETFIITRRREYGDRGVSTRTNQVKPAQFFTNQPIDTGLEQQLRARITELKGEIAELREQEQRHVVAAQELTKQREEAESEGKRLQKEKDVIQKVVAEFNALGVKLQNAQAKLDKINKVEANFRSKMQEISDKQGRLILEKSQESLNYATTVITLQRAYTGLIEAELLLLEARSDHETMEARNHDVTARVVDAERQVRDLTQMQNEARKVARDLIEKCNDMVASRSESHQTIQSEQSQEQTPEELENVIEGLHARLDMVHEGNPNVMREYEDRGRKIERTREKLVGIEKELSRLDENITDLRGQWEPELDALIAKISHAFGDNFARIGCAGQVEVYKDEDFENWAVQVLVKFRYVGTLVRSLALPAHRYPGRTSLCLCSTHIGNLVVNAQYRQSST